MREVFHWQEVIQKNYPLFESLLCGNLLFVILLFENLHGVLLFENLHGVILNGVILHGVILHGVSRVPVLLRS